jgi:hypothetical protein
MIWLHHPLSRAALLPVAIASMLVACSGEVVVDAGGTSGGGDGGAASTSSVGTGSSGSSGSGGTGSTGSGIGGCEGLEANLAGKVAAAQACNPVLAVPQCSGVVTTLDFCGCTVVANDTSSMAAQIATKAFNEWVGAGCGPFDCFTCPPGPDTPWYCDSAASICKPAFEK